MEELFQDITFDQQDYSQKLLPRGEYDSCNFTNCNFEQAHLSNYTFLECTFDECNFTNAKFGGTSLQQIDFIGCKLLGADFSVCNSFMLSLRFRESVLNLATFVGLKMKGTAFTNSFLTEVDFTEADLTEADFSGSKLDKAIFNQTILENTNFCNASNFDIIPGQNKLKGAQFSKDNLGGLVQHLPIKIH